jgi:hypothetical protein
MKNMKNTKQIAITLVLIGVSCGASALAQTAAPKVDAFRAKAEAATVETLRSYIYSYKPSKQQIARLKEVLIVQYKDLHDHDKVRAPKIKAMDDEIAEVNKKIVELQKEIALIAKRKAAYAEARAELKLDHKAEINSVITKEQRQTRLSSQIRGNAVYSQHAAMLPQADQDALKAKCDAAALELIDAGKADDSNAVYAVYKKVREEFKDRVTPEVRQAGDAKYLHDSVMRKFVKIKLTDIQKASISDMCDKAAKRKVEVYARYEKVGKDRAALDKDRSVLRRTISGMSTSSYYYKLRQDVADKVLTEEQAKLSGYKRK